MSDWLPIVDNVEVPEIPAVELEPESGGWLSRFTSRLSRNEPDSRINVYDDEDDDEEEPAFTLARFEFGVIGRRRKRRGW